MKRIILTALALLLGLALAAPALADVARGDRGDEVKEVQQLLIDMGWLFDVADGDFGRKTEAAVKEFQSYVDLPQTGVVDEKLLNRMWYNWHWMFYDDGTPRNFGEDWDDDGILDVPPDENPYEGLEKYEYLLGEDAQYVPPVYCEAVLDNGVSWRIYCAEHVALLDQYAQLSASGDPEAMAAANALWADYAQQLVTARLNSADFGARLDLLAAYGAWNAYIQASDEALAAACPQEPYFAAMHLSPALKDQAVALCVQCREEAGAELTDAASQIIPTARVADSPDYCADWSDDDRYEYVAACEAHRPLFAREQALLESGAAEAEWESLAGDWLDEVNALYERWIASAGDPAAREVIRKAQLAFHGALPGQHFLTGEDPARARVALLRSEGARLCGFINLK